MVPPLKSFQSSGAGGARRKQVITPCGRHGDVNVLFPGSTEQGEGVFPGGRSPALSLRGREGRGKGSRTEQAASMSSHEKQVLPECNVRKKVGKGPGGRSWRFS